MFKAHKSNDNNFTRIIKWGEDFYFVTQLSNLPKTNSRMLLESCRQSPPGSCIEFSFQVRSTFNNSHSGHCLLIWFAEGEVFFWDFLGIQKGQIEYLGMTVEEIKRERKGSLSVHSWILFTFKDSERKPSK